MRILDITNQIPYPLVSGAPLRTYNLLRRFAKDHEVHVAAFASEEQRKEDIEHLLQFCKSVVTVKHRALRKPGTLLGFLKYPFRGEPLELTLGFSRVLFREIQDLATRVQFDIVLIEHGSMGLYLKALPRALQKRSAWILHDIDFDKFGRIARIERRLDRKVRAQLHSMMMRRWQPRFAQSFGLCVTMSEKDRQLFLSTNPRVQVEVSPNGVDAHGYQPLPEQGETPAILFIGNMDYQPNADAAVYFCRDIFPLIRKEVADAELWIVGTNPRVSVKKLNGNGVTVSGSVPDVMPYYARSRVSIAPLRAGSGTRLKILEAMAMGRPVVSTSIGCEGLEVTDGEDIFIANDSEQFAARTIELLRDRALRSRLTAKAREHVAKFYDWDVIAEQLFASFTEIAACESTSSARQGS